MDFMEGKVSYLNPWAWYRWARPHPLLDKPWRPEGDPKRITNELAEKLCNDIKEIKYGRNITKAGVIVLGPSQSGKSSFINSLLSSMTKRIAKKTTSKGSDYSVTVKMVTVTGKDLNFWLCDTMGINENKYISNEEITSILEGKLEHGYKFGGDRDTFIKRNDGANDKIQTAVIVLAADKMKDIPSDPGKVCGVRDKLNEALEVLKCFDILPIYILTRVDVICEEVRKDPKMIFQSRAVQEMVRKVKDIFGPDENDIFPVVNYVKEIDTQTAKDIPLLFALRHIVQLASDHAEDDQIQS